jgi:hypothetical protein
VLSFELESRGGEDADALAAGINQLRVENYVSAADLEHDQDMSVHDVR